MIDDNDTVHVDDDATYEADPTNEAQDTQPLEPDDVLDTAQRIVHGDRKAIAGVALALGVYAVIITASCIGRYFATKCAVKAALRETRR